MWIAPLGGSSHSSRNWRRADGYRLTGSGASCLQSLRKRLDLPICSEDSEDLREDLGLSSSSVMALEPGKLRALFLEWRCTLLYHAGLASSLTSNEPMHHRLHKARKSSCLGLHYCNFDTSSSLHRSLPGRQLDAAKTHLKL